MFSVCLCVPGFFVTGFSYIFWSREFRNFFLGILVFTSFAFKIISFQSIFHHRHNHHNRPYRHITNGFFTIVFQQCDVVLFYVLSQNDGRNHVITTPITIKCVETVYLWNVSLCSPRMLSEIMRWKGFSPQCGVVVFSNDSLNCLP